MNKPFKTEASLVQRLDCFDFEANDEDFEEEELSSEEEKVLSQARALSRSLHSLETCPACETSYNLDRNMPKVLVQCGHSICEECVIRQTDRDELTCPICLKQLREIGDGYRLPTSTMAFTVVCKNNGLDEKLAKEQEELPNYRNNVVLSNAGLC